MKAKASATKPSTRTTKKPSERPKQPTADKAAADALRGKPDVALEALRPLAAAGDLPASAALVEILAFRGDWRPLVPHAIRVATSKLPWPDGYECEDVVRDHCAVLRRAARELADTSIVEATRGSLSKKLQKERSPWLDEDYVHDEWARPAPADRKRYDERLARASIEKAYRKDPRALARHMLDVALLLHVEDEAIARWDPDDALLHLDKAIYVARIHARRGSPERAWSIIESRLSQFYSLWDFQVAPLVLLLDPWLSPLMTRARCELVLSTPRGHHARSA